MGPRTESLVEARHEVIDDFDLGIGKTPNSGRRIEANAMLDRQNQGPQ